MKLQKQYYVLLSLVTLSLVFSVLPAQHTNSVKALVLPAGAWVRETTQACMNWLASLLPTSNPRIETATEREKHQAEELLAMQDEINRLRRQVATLADVRELEEEFGKFNFHLLPAHVLLRRDLSLVSRTMILDVGRADGVLEGMAVVCGRNVVGVVSQSGRTHCQVRLLTDPQFRAAGATLAGGQHGIVRGRGGDTLEMGFVSVDEKPQANDTVMTAGTDGLFPRGFIFGAIQSVNDNDYNKELDLEISVAAPLEHLDHVLVLIPKNS